MELLYLITLVLIILKAFGLITLTWFSVFIPALIALAITIGFIILAFLLGLIFVLRR